MAKSQQQTSVLFRLIRGFLYGTVIGLFAGLTVYLLSMFVNVVTELPVSPNAIFGIIWTSCMVAGVAHEYSGWLKNPEQL